MRGCCKRDAQKPLFCSSSIFHYKEETFLDKKLKMLEEIIGYTFKNEHLLPHALTHSSYDNERH